jgi:SAM-dependent methyltransferase
MTADSSYVYAGGPADAELERLRKLEAASAEDTDALFDRIGVGAGWHCLEVAAGAGSVARALADRVGTSGRVVAIDIDTRFLTASARSNLEVRRADVLVDDLEPSAFDLVHTRHLLAHLGVRAGEALGRMVAATRPGGWVVVEDADLLPLLLCEPSPPEQRAIEITIAGFARILQRRGGDLHLGRRLPVLLERAGLVDVDVDARLPFTRGGDERAQVSSATLEALRPLLVAEGAADEDLDVLLSALARPDQRGFAPLQVAAWGRRRP